MSEKLRPGMEMLDVVRSVRRRWRLKLALRGLALTAAAALLTFLASASGLEILRFRPEAIVALRVLLWAVVLAFLIRRALWPLVRPVSDERVALYLEENEPSLRSGALAAVESARRPDDLLASDLLRESVRAAVARCRRIDGGKRIERASIRRSAGALGALSLAAVALALLGPGFLRHGVTALVLPGRAAESANPYSVIVTPGDTVVARNSDLSISAVLRGFDTDEVAALTREAGAGEFAPVPMISDGMGSYEALLLNVAEETAYYVEADGVRSAVFAIGVADLPAVETLGMTYRFPAYTGLPPRVFEHGGDVATLRGTRVELRATPTLPTPAAALVMASGDTLAMELGADGAFTAAFTVEGDGFYGIEFLTAEGAWVAGAPHYRIEALNDRAPSIRFAKPGRDADASAIEEVFLDARAEDDQGISEVLLVASVNGRRPDTTRIHAAAGPPMREVSAAHTVFMEDLDLETGDLVAYHAVARDNAPTPNEAVTDIYFLRVRPFRRDYREAETGGAPGGGGGGGMDQDLSAVQRQIIAASFNLVRDRDAYAPEAWDENVVSVALGQRRLKEQVETLAQRIVNRGIAGADETFLRISEALPRAAEAMGEAEDSLRALSPQGAIAPEQRALRELQRAEETYERFVSQERGGAGGGGGGQGPSAEDLVDLFELETDQLRNQYETVQRSRLETADQAVDESLERLRELARRQERELERQRRRAAAQRGATAGGGGEAARELAEEAEEAARRLERLSRETGERELEDVARELDRAADAMRRSAANRGSEGVSEAQSALRRLRDARDRLEGAQDDRVERDLADARRRVDDLASRQRDVQRRMEAMDDASRPSPEEVGRVRATKGDMAEQVGDVLDRLDRLANGLRRDGQPGADEIGEATRTIRETQLRERLLWSRQLVGRPGQEDYADAFENQTAQAIRSLGNRLDEAAAAVRSGEEEDVRAEALELARDLARSLESMERRPRSSAESGQAPAPSQGDGEAPASAADRAGAGGAPAEFDPDAVRRMRREARERVGEARDLVGLLQRSGADPRELRAMIGAMRALIREQTYADPQGVQRLRRELVEGMKQLEFRLRREFGAGVEDQVLVDPAGEVPEEYREMVEEYYRALSRAGPPDGPPRGDPDLR